MRANIIGAALLGLLAPAAAEEPAPLLVDEARRHFQQGVALYQRGDYHAALAEFSASYDREPAAPILFNIGLTQRALFRYLEAIDSLSRYLAAEKATGPKQRDATRMVAEMRALLGPLTVVVTPPGASVSIDDVGRGAAPIEALQLAAGDRVVEIAADGYRTERKRITVAAGVPQTITVELAPQPHVGTLRIVSSPAHATILRRKAGRRGAGAGRGRCRRPRAGAARGRAPFLSRRAPGGHRPAARRRRQARFAPPPRTPLARRWWLW